MKHIILTILLCIIANSLSAQNDADSTSILFIGKVNSTKTDFKPLYLHIINLRTSKGIISDSTGLFKLKILKTDTIRMSCMGFKTKKVNIPDSITTKTYFKIIYLEPTSYIMKDIDVMALGTKSQFAYNFINTPIDLKALDNFMEIPGVTNPNHRKIHYAKRHIYPQYIGTSILDLGFITKKMKKFKKLKKLSNIVKEDALIKKNNYKYNIDIVSAISKYKNDTLTAFFMFLNLSPQYINNNTIYEISDHIKKQKPAFEEHLKKHGIPKFLKEKNKTNK